MTGSPRRRVVLDVDTGVDDALAILLAVAHPALEVAAITCVGGNVDLPRVVRNTLRVLDAAGAPDIPVAAGLQRPLIERPQGASSVHGVDGLAAAGLPESSRVVRPEHAVDLLRRTLLDSPEPVTIIALAPLTTLAVLLRMHPEVAPRIERIVLMGGAVGPGNATAVAEFNVWHDPEAAAIVLGSGVPTTMYGLEPFYAVTCDAGTIDRLGASPEPRAALAGHLLRHLAGVTEPEARVPLGSAAIGDAGAVAAVIDPGALTTVRAPVVVGLAPGPARGQTIVDLRTGLGAAGEETGAGGHVDVVLAADGPRLSRLFLETVAPGLP